MIRQQQIYLLAVVWMSLLMLTVHAQDTDPPSMTLSVKKIATLTGPDATSSTQDIDICGTDLGTMTEVDGSIYVAFGDTFGFRDGNCPRFGPNWRSNVLGMTQDTDPSDGVVWANWLTDESGTAIAMSDGAHDAAFTGEQTRIPTAMVTVGEQLYLHYMSVYGFSNKGGVWLCNYSRFIYSDDAGESWTESSNFASHGDGFNMLALSHQAGQGNEDRRYVYAIGTPCGRFGGARVARVLAGDILTISAWEYFDGNGWSNHRLDAVEVIKPNVGEGSLVWNAGLDRWMYSYLNEATAAIELRLSETPWGPWDEVYTLARATTYPALYGAYMTPSWLSDDGKTFYFIMSQFGPYNTYVMEARFE
ncbi:MAG: DUF4185 domain-containing protein [Deinococcota bacterium]